MTLPVVKGFTLTEETWVHVVCDACGEATWHNGTDPGDTARQWTELHYIDCPKREKHQ